MKKNSVKKNLPILSAPSSTILWRSSFLIVLLTFFFYFPAINNGFVNWDDSLAIVENYSLRTIDFTFFKWMWTTFLLGNWIPLTWFSLALDYAIGHLDARIYHLHNILLHLINTLLVFFLSLKILKILGENDQKPPATKKILDKIPDTIWIGVLTALLFGLHPLHVESVAWITERKDLLFTLFYFGSLLVYLDYASSEKKEVLKWSVCLLLFGLSLLSKPMAITFPFVILLFDVFVFKNKRGNFAKCLLEKIPFFVFSIAISIVTLFAQDKAEAIKELAFDFRLMNAFHSLIFYLWKMMIPMHLVAFYPLGHQGADAFSLINVFSAFLVIAISSICYLYRKNRPYLLLSWLFYLITLAPVLGIIQAGGQAAADRYIYLPCFAPFLLFSGFLIRILSHYRLALAFGSSMIVLVLGILTVNQIGVWKNSITLWEKVVQAYPDYSYVVHGNMGNAYRQFLKFDKALVEYNRALAIWPNYILYDGRGMILLEKELVDEAIEDFHRAIEGDPYYASPQRNLWFAYNKKGRPDLAFKHIQEAVKINPDFVEAYNELGISYGEQGKFDESIATFKKALSKDPHNSKYLINLATTLQRCGKLDEAIEWYKRGLKLNGENPVYFINLAHTYTSKGLFKEAVITLQNALKLTPSNPDIFQKLGTIYEKTGESELAKRNYERARQLKPNLRP